MLPEELNVLESDLNKEILELYPYSDDPAGSFPMGASVDWLIGENEDENKQKAISEFRSNFSKGLKQECVCSVSKLLVLTEHNPTNDRKGFYGVIEVKKT